MEQSINWIDPDIEIYCRFFVRTSEIYHHSVKEPLSVEEILNCLRQYVQWANPSSKIAPSEITVPNVPAELLEETHCYIMLWTYRFCCRLNYHIGTGVRLPLTENIDPPTDSELARISRAYYQLWICLTFHEINVKDLPAGSEYPGGFENLSQLKNSMFFALVDSISYVDFTVMYRSIANMFQGDPKYDYIWHIIDHNRVYAEFCYRQPNFEEIRTYNLSPRPTANLVSYRALEWLLFTRLGPKGFWEFLFKSTCAEQLDIALREYPPLFFDQIDSFWSQYTHQFRDKQTFPPLRSILKEELVIGSPELDWWNCWPTQIGSSMLVRGINHPCTFPNPNVIVWDDWRLEKAGFYRPMIPRGVIIPDEFVSHGQECSDVEPYIIYKEHGKQTARRDFLFLGMKEDKPTLKQDVRNVQSRKQKSISEHTPKPSIYLPPEILYNVLRLSHISQYRTLSQVCQAWRRELHHTLRKRYIEPYRPSPDEIMSQYPGRRYFPFNYRQATQSQTPFLIHSALCEFTGYIRGRIDWPHRPRRRMGFEFGKIYSKPDPDDPGILADTEMFKRYADDPILIPNTDAFQISPHAIYLCLDFDRRDPVYTRPSDLIAVRGKPLSVHGMMTVQEFFAWYFDTQHQETPKLRGVPKAGEKTGKFTQYVLMSDEWSGAPDSAPATWDVYLTLVCPWI
ncbi:hypothetical protein H072_344 [Dactylellina haptotyla CBS 200.50]|uniref:F-box domain-containing protein n=1 Tax=Dactylellina haptotyla (strain CBS 200.50) TaxID=1284197 RepID=S8CD88_DACHA|nr:hypothetical protein H072_344 [Dactylellina haptotyla CBS 200.50]